MTAICVLGMSRSGTSLTARALNLAGVYLGSPEELLSSELRELPDRDRVRARAANAGGFWEHYRIMRLNERVLRVFGGNWREPPVLPPGWQDSPGLADLRDEARALLASSFAGHDPWGWKDPRNSLTLPFWRSLVPDLRCVLCVRNPLDVAASLARRDGIPVERGLDLWLTYVESALSNTSGLPRLLLHYEDYFGARDATVAGLTRFAGRGDVLGEAAARDAAVAAVDERLWRNRASPGELTRDGRVSDEVLATYRQLERLVANEARNA